MMLRHEMDGSDVRGRRAAVSCVPSTCGDGDEDATNADASVEPTYFQDPVLGLRSCDDVSNALDRGNDASVVRYVLEVHYA
jgi:hypothetical protein